MDWSIFTNQNAWVLFLIVLVIVVAIMGTIFEITKLVIRHRERMAMIEHGMNPDSLKKADENE